MQIKIWIQLLGPPQDMGTKSSNTHNIWLVNIQTKIFQENTHSQAECG